MFAVIFHIINDDTFNEQKLIFYSAKVVIVRRQKSI